ncbi:MAG: CDGSH iron-sulfur domain-containing protein [Candidatus Zixiibacteriota bacterium]
MSSEPIKIKLIPNGPIRVMNGSFEIELSNGTIMTKEAPFSMCRCGNSNNKPFCDGTHKTCGFQG